LPAMKRVPTTWWNWKRGKHSVKPDAFQEMIETVSPGPYLELFARRKRDGWEAWGNEV
jgi:N6-adenosine-specific RNA methylase IME4